MGKFKIEMTEDEMIRFYANKIVEDGIKDCYEFSNVIDIIDYGNDIAKYKNVILERIYRDERVADVNLDNEGNFDMVFYTDFCPYYYDMDKILENNYLIDPFAEIEMLKEFGDYYIEKCLFNNPYISMRNLINEFVEGQTDNQEKREVMANIIKMKVNESDFIRDNIDGIEVYITPHNYKELKEAIKEIIGEVEQEEFE